MPQDVKQKTCPQCRARVGASAKRCPRCDAPLEEPRSNRVDEASAESFPASDPPGY